MFNQEDLVKAYNYIYKAGNVKNPEKPGRMMGPYGSHANRDSRFIRWIKENIPKGSRILDASCGRGHLAYSLHKLGYRVEATEISGWLIKHELSKLPFPVHLLRYDQFDQISAKSFDCVCSNDVLEHLLSKEAALDAIDQLFRISRKAVCICVGTGEYAVKYPRSLAINKFCEITDKKRLKPSLALNLHTCRASSKWWRGVVMERFSREDQVVRVKHRSVFMFGFIKVDDE